MLTTILTILCILTWLLIIMIDKLYNVKIFLSFINCLMNILGCIIFIGLNKPLGYILCGLGIFIWLKLMIVLYNIRQKTINF